MTFSMIRIFSLIAIAGLAGASAAQASLQARFHLPMAVQWGGNVLQPGDYKLVVTDDLRSGLCQLVIQGEGQMLRKTPVTVDFGQRPDRSSLELVEVNGSYFVHEYRSGAGGRTFTFGVPRQLAGRHARTVEIAN